MKNKQRNKHSKSLKKLKIIDDLRSKLIENDIDQENELLLKYIQYIVSNNFYNKYFKTYLQCLLLLYYKTKGFIW